MRSGVSSGPVEPDGASGLLSSPMLRPPIGRGTVVCRCHPGGCIPLGRKDRDGRNAVVRGARPRGARAPGGDVERGVGGHPFGGTPPAEPRGGVSLGDREHLRRGGGPPGAAVPGRSDRDGADDESHRPAGHLRAWLPDVTRFLRTPSQIVGTLIFPLLFLVFMGTGFSEAAIPGLPAGWGIASIWCRGSSGSRCCSGRPSPGWPSSVTVTSGFSRRSSSRR